MRWAKRSMPIWRHRTCGSRWVASRRSSRSTTTSRPNGQSRRSGLRSACAPTSWCGGCTSASRRRGCCTTAWVNGIRASLRRAGRSRSTGGATASRCGAMRRWSRARARRAVPPRMMQSVSPNWLHPHSASRLSACSRPMRIRRTGCSRRASCPSMSRCLIRSCSMRKRAPACCAPSNAGSERRRHMCCRFAATATRG